MRPTARSFPLAGELRRPARCAGDASARVVECSRVADGGRGGEAPPLRVVIAHAALADGRRRADAVAARIVGAALLAVFIKEIESTAGLLGFNYRVLEAPGSEDFELNFAMMRQWPADAIFVLDD